MGGKAVVFLNGGLVQNIIANEPMQIMVIDSDVEGCDEVRTIREWDFDKNCPSDPPDLYDVFDGGDREPNVNPAAVCAPKLVFSDHADIGGHPTGAGKSHCLVKGCTCQRFTWKQWTKKFERFLESQKGGKR